MTARFVKFRAAALDEYCDEVGLVGYERLLLEWLTNRADPWTGVLTDVSYRGIARHLGRSDGWRDDLKVYLERLKKAGAITLEGFGSGRRAQIRILIHDRIVDPTGARPQPRASTEGARPQPRAADNSARPQPRAADYSARPQPRGSDNPRGHSRADSEIYALRPAVLPALDVVQEVRQETSSSKNRMNPGDVNAGIGEGGGGSADAINDEPLRLVGLLAVALPHPYGRMLEDAGRGLGDVECELRAKTQSGWSPEDLIAELVAQAATFPAKIGSIVGLLIKRIRDLGPTQSATPAPANPTNEIRRARELDQAQARGRGLRHDDQLTIVEHFELARREYFDDDEALQVCLIAAGHATKLVHQALAAERTGIALAALDIDDTEAMSRMRSEIESDVELVYVAQHAFITTRSRRAPVSA